jgi:hypothetical protein
MFPLQPPVFRGPPEGAMIAVVDPRQADAVIVAKAMPPLWQYFSRSASHAGGQPGRRGLLRSLRLARGAENEQGVLMLRGV